MSPSAEEKGQAWLEWIDIVEYPASFVPTSQVKLTAWIHENCGATNAFEHGDARQNVHYSLDEGAGGLSCSGCGFEIWPRRDDPVKPLYSVDSMVDRTPKNELCGVEFDWGGEGVMLRCELSLGHEFKNPHGRIANGHSHANGIHKWHGASCKACFPETTEYANALNPTSALARDLRRFGLVVMPIYLTDKLAGQPQCPNCGGTRNDAGRIQHRHWCW